MVQERKNIVVFGAGFGGLRAARKIAQGLHANNLLEKYELILVDRSEHHTFTPLLYEAATTSKETANISKLHELVAYPIVPLIRNEPISFFRKDIIHVDTEQGILAARDGSKLRADYLIIATGVEVNYFDIPGLEKYALPIKTFYDAIRIRETIWGLISSTSGEIDVVIGGGGSTGVELAGEIVMWCGEIREHFPLCRVHVRIIEAAETILSGFPSSVIVRAQKRLRKLGVTLIAGDRIQKADEHRVILASGKNVPFAVLIWAGGVRAPSLFASMPLKTSSQGRVEVSPSLECIDARNDLKIASTLYALGDSVCFYNPVTQKPIPGVARAALSQADIVAHNILEDIKKSEGIFHGVSYKVFRPQNYPYVIPIGGKYAIATLGPLVISGFPAWILKGLVELNYLLSIMPPHKALGIWLKGLRIFMQNDRLG